MTLAYPEQMFGSPLDAVRSRSACLGMDPQLWYPPRGATAVTGRAICAGCPVMPQCLEHALATGEKEGVWGGASERERRRLAVVWVQRRHDYFPECDDPRCRWCRAVDANRAACAGEQPAPLWWNGSGARCGFRSTYARGCRCVPCSVAISPMGARLRAGGYEVAEWCRRYFGPTVPTTAVEDETRQRRLRHAWVLSELDAEAVAA